MRRVLAAAATALLTVASFPPFDLGPLALAALVPLLLVTARSARGDFFLGWLAGTLASAGIAWWVVYAMAHYGGVAMALAVPIMLLMASVMGLYWALFAWARGAIRRRMPGVPDLLLVPALWTAVEYARAVTPDLAFPWALLGHALHRQLVLIQASDIFGVWGVSFLVALVNAALAGAFGPGPRGPRARVARVAAAVSALALFAGYGAWRLADAGEGRRVRVAVVQGNVPQDVKWDPAFREETYRIHERLTREAAADGARLVVWSESATAFVYQRRPDYQRRLSDLAAETGAAILFGSTGEEGEGEGRSLRNRVWLIDEQGRLAGWQDKQHLVPFGEYVPWRRALFFVDKLVAEVGEFLPGDGPRVLESPAGRLGSLVCFEVIFPDLVRRFPLGGAELLVNVTNDAWYERSAASRQHFVSAVFRAVESRRPLARAANTGISGFVDSRGRVLLDTPLFVRGQYAADLELSSERTLYTRFGDWLPRACAAAALFLLAAAAVSRARRPGGGLELPPL